MMMTARSPAKRAHPPPAAWARLGGPEARF